MQEANDRLSSELGTVTEECKSQVAEVQHEVEYLKENIQSLADEKAMVSCCELSLSLQL